MKYQDKRLMLGAAVIVAVMLIAVTRARAVQEWYQTVTVHGRVTLFLLDDQARVEGLLLDEGSQVHFDPGMAAVIIDRVTTGDALSVVGRGGRSSSFGRVVHATELTINGQTLATTYDGPRHGPPPEPRGSRGPHGPQRGNAPPPPDGGRGAQFPPPPPPLESGYAAIAPPPAAGVSRQGAPYPPPPATAVVGAPRPDAPPPPIPPAPQVNRLTIRAKVQNFLVGDRGELIGLALDNGDQVHFAPRVGEALTAQTPGAHPDVVVEGDAVRGDHGTMVRPTRLTVGTRTLIVR